MAAKPAEEKKEAPGKRVVVEEVAAEETPKQEVADTTGKSVETIPPVENPVEETGESNMTEMAKSGEEPEKSVDAVDEKTEEETPSSLEEEKEETEKPKMTLKQVLLIAIPTALIVAGLTGGILNYLNKNKKEEVSPTPTPVAVATDEPTASPAAQLERSDLSVQVLNGSGIAGLAGNVQDLLEGLGYEDVKTANADSYDYEEMEVSIKEESEDYLDMVLEDLEAEYTLADDTTTLDEDELFDVVIIVGSK